MLSKGVLREVLPKAWVGGAGRNQSSVGARGRGVWDRPLSEEISECREPGNSAGVHEPMDVSGRAVAKTSGAPGAWPSMEKAEAGSTKALVGVCSAKAFDALVAGSNCTTGQERLSWGSGYEDIGRSHLFVCVCDAAWRAQAATAAGVAAGA